MPKEKKTAASRAEGKAEKLVLEYLIKQNRPYSVTDIVNNLHNAVSKTECQKAVNALVDKELVITKLYGKQAIYVVRQDTIDLSSPAELVAMDKELVELQAKITNYKNTNKRITSELSAFNSALTTDQMKDRLEQLKIKNEQANEHLRLLRSGTELVSAEQKRKATKDMECHRKLWQQRKRLFKDMFDTVTENLPGKPKDLLEELDIDMQDPVNININPRELLQA